MSLLQSWQRLLRQLQVIELTQYKRKICWILATSDINDGDTVHDTYRSCNMLATSGGSLHGQDVDYHRARVCAPCRADGHYIAESIRTSSSECPCHADRYSH